MWCFERVASLHGVYVRMHSENKIQLSGGGMTHKLIIDFGCIKENKKKSQRVKSFMDGSKLLQALDSD